MLIRLNALLKKKSTGVDVVKYILTMGIITLFFINNSANLGYNWQWYRVTKYLFHAGNNGIEPGLLLQGMLITIKISVISLVISCLIGLLAALLKLSNSIVGRVLAATYIEAIRNTPLLIQILFIYFVFAPMFGIGAFVSAVLALSLFEGAYASEIIRGGIQAVPKGQWEAALSLGMTTPQTYRYVVLPQALRTMMPPLASQAISLIKDSSLVSVIAIYDLTMQGQAVVAETFLSFEIWFTVAVLYLLMTLPLSRMIRYLEFSMGKQ
jgi:polar amino acid transport system permease protein